MTLQDKILKIPFSNIGVSWITVTDKYVKWYAPSIDYPCILSPYYLYLPFQIQNSTSPKLEVSHEVGERDDLIYVIKNIILCQMLKYKIKYISNLTSGNIF